MRCQLLYGNIKYLSQSEQHCMWSLGQNQCEVDVGGFYNPLPLQANWFCMSLSVADPPRARTNGLEEGRERGSLKRPIVCVINNVCAANVSNNDCREKDL